MPERLSICLWIWGWITSALPEEPCGDLARATAGLAYLEFMAEQAIRHGSWGCLPTTYCGPDQPLWQQHPDWLRRINRRFVTGEQA